MVDDAEEVNIQDKLHAAISAVLAEVEPEENALVSRWVLAVERVHERGSSCSYIASEGMSTWEVLGMTSAAGTLAKAQLTYAYDLYDEDEDEDED